ncbi:MAG: hypothetical protein RDU59_04170 [Thermodesulfobacteriota bacterium]|nr:hypothetical protein [Thermodesulfobacteriota bacterium]
MLNVIGRVRCYVKGLERYKYFEEYSKIQWLTLDEVNQFQFETLKDLIRHAYTTVPYYAKLFNELGITPEDIRTHYDYSQLPVLTRETVKLNLPTLCSTKYDIRSLILNCSGGSTGEPLSFYQDQQLFEKMYANWMLGLSWAGWNGKGTVISLWGNPKEFQKATFSFQKIKEIFSNNIILNAYSYDAETMNRWIKTIESKKEVFVYGYSSVLAELAQFIQHENIAVTNVRAVLTSAEQLFGWQREMIGKNFQCKVYDQYGSREVPGIASECANGNMHILSHSAYVEFVKDDNRLVKKIIVTSLTNYAMPLMRYEIGDFGQPKDDVCACGRGFPLMQMGIGRTCDCFITPERKTIYGTLFVRQMYGINGVKNFQFHQTNERNINLYIVKSQIFTLEDEKKIENIKLFVKERVSKDMDVAVHFVDAIPKTTGGKHRHIISEMQREKT